MSQFSKYNSPISSFDKRGPSSPTSECGVDAELCTLSRNRRLSTCSTNDYDHLSAHVASAECQVNAIRNELHSAKHCFKDQLDRSKAETAEVLGQLSSTNTTLNSIKSQKADLERQFERARAESQSSFEVTAMQRKLKELQSTLIGYEDRLALWQDEYNKVCKKRQEETSRLERLSSERLCDVEHWQRKFTQLEEVSTDQMKKLKRQEGMIQLQLEKTARTSALEDELREINRKYDTKSSMMDKMTTNIGQLKFELKTIESLNKKLQNDAQDHREQLVVFRDTETRCENLAVENRILKEETSQLQMRLDCNQQKLLEAEILANELNSKLSKSLQSNSDLNRKVQSFRERAEANSMAVEREHERQMETLRAELALSNLNARQYREDCDMFQSEIERLKKNEIRAQLREKILTRENKMTEKKLFKKEHDLEQMAGDVRNCVSSAMNQQRPLYSLESSF
eukprot:GHVL01033412.1.p1 GENE.GHVL01033412.1~~GHVL01033412.1.p1  ORF type:complete len:456 (-),score=75.88 GHVL01033412.1:1316-2683(-)